MKYPLSSSFLMADRGYLRKAEKLSFRDRIHEVPSKLLADNDKLETVLRQIVVPPSRGTNCADNHALKLLFHDC